MRTLSRSLDKWQADLPVDIRYDPTQSDQVVPPPHVLSLQLVTYQRLTLYSHDR